MATAAKLVPQLYLALDLPRRSGAAGAYDLYIAFFRDSELLRFCYEVGYILFGLQAVELMFMLVSRRYERASLIRHLQQSVASWCTVSQELICSCVVCLWPVVGVKVRWMVVLCWCVLLRCSLMVMVSRWWVVLVVVCVCLLVILSLPAAGA